MTPTNRSRPRRGRMDAQDRLWFAEFGAGKLAVFDTKTATFKEWDVPTPYSAPYDAVADRFGGVWTSGMNDDRVTRIDTITGDTVQYLMPRPTNVRRVFVDDSGPRPVFWTGSNHNASIVKVEPLE
jgi:streptogramin lyase